METYSPPIHNSISNKNRNKIMGTIIDCKHIKYLFNMTNFVPVPKTRGLESWLMNEYGSDNQLTYT